jgi:hypothetical protein
MLLSACGDETAPVGATISAPSDATINVSSGGFPPDMVLTFGVTDANGNALPGVEIDFFAASSATGGSASQLLDDGSNALVPGASTLKTDDRGLATVIFQIGFSTACAGTDDGGGIVSASVRVAVRSGPEPYTVKCT